MLGRSLRNGIAVAALTVSLLVPTGAYAATARINVNSGIKSARLGQRDTTAAGRIGRVVRKKRDSSYAGRVVWVRYFGRRSGGKYALEMFSDKRHKVFAFVVNGTGYATTNGIRVGSSEAALTAAYGSALSSSAGPVYTHYTLGGSKGTDFYVAGGQVTKIIVRSY